ncbi:MAG: hypothetical protein U9R29_06705 [Thermodesulfobacteriota bacterium]|nr:hypothetical protein [Thermodesulfobacteriota bacterium]
MYLPVYLLCAVLLLISGCAPTIQQKTAGFADLINHGETVAVTAIYEESSGDVTALGNRWRDEIEAGLSQKKIVVKARRDIGFIIDDIDSFGTNGEEQKIWENSGADLLISGSYRLQPNATPPHALLTLKLLDTHTSNVRQTFNLTKDLYPCWAKSAAQVSGNAYQQSVEIVVDSSSAEKKPRLSASFARKLACFPPGAAGTVLVQTDPGTHIYLLNLAADQTVTLLYPNTRLPDQKLTTGRFKFPSDALSKELQLVFYPLIEGQMSHESIKVIASYFPIDFSYLPIPENAIYAGAQGGKIKQVLGSLKKARGWSEQVLDYWVGPECE